jgi:ParB-like chromosome segregation protein Spo0J
MSSIRNRIVEHVQVRAGDLVPHPFNYRRHSRAQRQALAASYEEVGFARSLLGYRRDDGRIQLIDGHLRRDLHPDMLVTVEVLDVSEDEARKLLLTLDPLAALAENDAAVLAELTKITAAQSQALKDFWQSLANEKPNLPAAADEPPALGEQFLILIQCRDEAQQAELLARFDAEGIPCKPLMS